MRKMEELARNKRPALLFVKSFPFAGIRVIRGRLLSQKRANVMADSAFD